MVVDIIIPTKSAGPLKAVLTQCIRSLRASEPDTAFNVVLIESSAEAFEAGQDMTIMYDQPIFNYNRALKQGIAATSQEWVVMANNDLIFHPFWFSEILACWNSYPGFKSFSPWNSRNGYHSFIFGSGLGSIIPGYRVCYEVCGWCLVCRREILSQIDLSERVDLWYSDNIYADELQKHGIAHALVRNSIVDHITSQTIDFSKYDSRLDLLKYRGEA